jgi:hypothetical protein
MHDSEQEEDAAGRAWFDGIAREWGDELADIRQDIYSISDGRPIQLDGP